MLVMCYENVVSTNRLCIYNVLYIYIYIYIYKVMPLLATPKSNVATQFTAI